jgi:hypothetical protein
MGLFVIAGVATQVYQGKTPDPSTPETRAAVRAVHSVPLFSSIVVLVNLASASVIRSRRNRVSHFNVARRRRFYFMLEVTCGTLSLIANLGSFLGACFSKPQSSFSKAVASTTADWTFVAFGLLGNYSDIYVVARGLWHCIFDMLR